MMSRTLRVGVAQLRSGIEPAANREAALPLLRQAAAEGARLILTPENTHRMDKDRARALAAAEAEDQQAALKAWGRIARELGTWLLMGSMPAWVGGGKVANRSLLFGPDGLVRAHYDKINLFDVDLGGGETYRESASVQPGAQAVVAEGPGGAMLGMTVCYDLRFPELFRALAGAGAEIIAVPAAFTVPTGRAHWETLLRARAIETGAFVIAPAQGGLHEDGRATFGHSLIIDPWGRVMASKPDEAPGVILADLDLGRVAEARAQIPAWRGGGEFSGP
jgi:predicted amidohydrolase